MASAVNGQNSQPTVGERAQGDHARPAAELFQPTNADLEAEHRRVFINPSRARQTFRPVRQPSRARQTMRKRTPTSTVKFVCLSNVHARKPPSNVAEKAALANSGLGPGTIVFQANGDANNFHETLVGKFPLLSTGGGYELLLYQRGGLQQGFHKIVPPFTPARVKEVSGQAVVYIRPLQKNLTLVMQEDVVPPHEAVRVQYDIF